jgi:hypothetical protein
MAKHGGGGDRRTIVTMIASLRTLPMAQRPSNLAAGICIAIGVAAGALVGMLIGDMTLGVGAGIGLGILAGFVIVQRRSGGD